MITVKPNALYLILFVFKFYPVDEAADWGVGGLCIPLWSLRALVLRIEDENVYA